MFTSSRPDAQLLEEQEEEQMNRELPDDLFRRQLINNLAKHVLFSKKFTIPQVDYYTLTVTPTMTVKPINFKFKVTVKPTPYSSHEHYKPISLCSHNNVIFS